MSTIDSSKLKHLAIFALVTESGSFAEAARKLNTSRSRVSEQVAQLEEALGMRLLQRSTRKLSLTCEGREVYEQACVLAPLVECVNDIASAKEPSGKVSLSLSNDIAQTLLLPCLDEFRAQYPKIQLDLNISDNLADLIGGEIDLAIRTRFCEDSAMVARTLHKECPQVFASSHYLERYGLPKTLKELEAHHWLTLAQSSNDGSQVFFVNGDKVTIFPESYYSCNSPYVIQKMLLSGLGLGAILPSSMTEEIASGMLIPIMPKLMGQELTVSLIYPSRRQVPKRTRCLIDYLLKVNEVKG